MTDARLPGYWLNEMRFMDLSDRSWRIFTNALMWSAEQGTDGKIPARYVRTLHPDGVTEPDLDPLVECGVIEYTAEGLQLLRWSDRSGLRQSLAADVEDYRRRKRESMATLRQARRAQSVTEPVLENVTDAVTGNVTGLVGGGGTTPEVSKATAYLPGNVAGNARHQHEPNALEAITRIRRERSLPIAVDELLEHAYRLGDGDPWDGYRAINALTESAITGASNPAAVLRKRLRDAA